MAGDFGGGGGSGAGCISILAKLMTLSVGGIISAVGGNGAPGNSTGAQKCGGGAGGGGGVVVLTSEVITDNGITFTLNGGSGGAGANGGLVGGAGVSGCKAFNRIQ